MGPIQGFLKFLLDTAERFNMTPLQVAYVSAASDPDNADRMIATVKTMLESAEQAGVTLDKLGLIMDVVQARSKANCLGPSTGDPGGLSLEQFSEISKLTH